MVKKMFAFAIIVICLVASMVSLKAFHTKPATITGTYQYKNTKVFVSLDTKSKKCIIADEKETLFKRKVYRISYNKLDNSTFGFEDNYLKNGFILTKKNELKLLITKPHNHLYSLKKISNKYSAFKNLKNTKKRATIPNIMKPSSVIYYTDDSHYRVLSKQEVEKIDFSKLKEPSYPKDMDDSKMGVIQDFPYPVKGVYVTYGTDGQVNNIYSKYKTIYYRISYMNE
ncbi:hypothetical protein [Intestinibaculum porci]|uniref:hypothetical protein n=1 Tax=Intestinibaculum porci TaxID=2487118 RepID=UPI002409385D|nr:hypothetical protein [Intestinibaculum porci]MDD6350599.1 hypothetical protein [Intestinibaculum porci]MDD6422681.1 hypothetical protein [Intestinibaculum porci]